MKGPNDEIQLKKSVSLNIEKKKEEQSFSTGFKQVEKQDEEVVEKEEEQIEEKIQSGFKEATMRDGIDELQGEIPGQPKYIGMEKRFTTIREDDSDRMQAVRLALDTYLGQEKRNNKKKAASDKLIAACDAYCKGRFRIFKFGKARQRLDEVIALRQKVMEEREEIFSNTSQEEEKEDEFIYNDPNSVYKMEFTQRLRKKGVGKLIAAGFGAIFGTFIGNTIKLLTLQPLWRKEVVWKPKDYFNGTIDLIERTFGRVQYVDKYDEDGNLVEKEGEKKIVFDTKTSLKDKDASETLKAEMEMLKADKQALEDGDLDDDFDEDAYQDEGYEKEKELKELKKDLIKLYQSKEVEQEEGETLEEALERHAGEIEDLEDEITKRTEEALEFRTHIKQRDPEAKYLDDQTELDNELMKLKIAYHEETSRKKIRDEAGEEEFKEELRDLAFDNIAKDVHIDDGDLKQRDEAYSKKELTKLLDEFEKFDFASISFKNPYDMLKDYTQNMAAFEYIRSVHYRLFRGLNNGYSIGDEKLIKLRAKFTAAFEMQEYLVELNRLAASNRLDLTKDGDELKKQLEEHFKDKRMHRYIPDLGNPAAFVAKIEQKIREEYENREPLIRKMLSIVENGNDTGDDISSSDVKKKMAAYEKNAITFDYLHRRHNRYKQGDTAMLIHVYNERNNTEIPEMGASRMHGTFIYGKSNEEKVRLTEMFHGSPKEKFDYWMEVLKDLKSIPLKEFDIKDPAKFFDNYERKETVMQLYTNAIDIYKGINEVLKKMFKDGDTEDVQALMDELKEMGYNTMEDLKKDMTITNNFGNNIQGKMTSLVQSIDNGYLPFYSLQELFALDAEKKHDFQEHYEYYKENSKDAEKRADEEGTMEYFLDDMRGRMDFISYNITTRPITREEKKAGKLQESISNKHDVMELWNEEWEYYDKQLYMVGRENMKPEDREKECELAKKQVGNIDFCFTSRNYIVNEMNVGKEQRFIKGYVGPMAYLRGDSEEKTKERAEALKVDPAEATAEEKQALAEELEDAFLFIMEYDLNNMSIEKVTDVLKDDYLDAAVMAKFCYEFNVLFDRYKKLIEDPDVNTKLSKDDFLEVKAKKDFIQLANTMFYSLSGLFANDKHKDYDVVKYIMMTEEELSSELKGKKPEVQVLISNASVVAAGIHKEGFGPGVDINWLFERTRVERHGAPEEDNRKKLIEKLKKE